MIFINAEDLRYLQEKIPINQKLLCQCRLAEDGPEMQKTSAQCRRLGKSGKGKRSTENLLCGYTDEGHGHRVNH